MVLLLKIPLSEYPKLLLISALVPVIPFLIGLIRWRNLDLPQQYLTAVVGLSFIVQVTGLIIALNQWDNYWLYQFYTPLALVGYLAIYREWLRGWWAANIFLLIGLGFCLFALFNAIWIQAAQPHTLYAVWLSHIILIVLAITFFYRVISEMSLGPLELSPVFWINTSILLYTAGSMLILGLNHLILRRSEGMVNNVWYFHSAFNILHYLLFALGLWIKPK